MATNPFSFNSNENSQNDSSNNEESSERASARIVPAGESLLMGYLLAPAQIVVQVVPPPGVKVLGNVSLDVKDLNLNCPDVDIAPLFEEMRKLKKVLKEILDTKQLSQEIGNELVGETYLRWDTKVRFYPQIVFIFLESEEDYLKRSVLDKSQYRKKVQIKLRITSHTLEEFENDENFLKSYVINLKSKFLNLIDTYNFSAGNVRCTYVNQGKVSWKTTRFARDKREAIMILTRLCNLIGQIINSRSFTSSDVRSANEKEASILVYLHKVSLLINKKKHPIVLYHV